MRMIDRGLVFDGSHAPPDQVCSAFTSLALLSDGAVLCSFGAGTTKAGPDANGIIMKSMDGGVTWSRLAERFDTTVDDTPGSINCVYPIELSPGRLLCSFMWVDRSDPTLPLANPDTNGLLPLKTLLAESNDGGRTWNDMREVDLRPHKANALTNELIRLDTGDLLLAYESWREWEETEGTQAAYVRLSSDDGRTWSDGYTMASDPKQGLYFWDNRIAKDPTTGRLVVMYWTHRPAEGVDTDMHIAFGEPDGRAWTQPRSMGIAGQIAAPLPLRDGRLLCFYVHRHDPPSMRLVMSNDGGQTWDATNELVVYESGRGREAGMGESRKDAEYWADMFRWTFGHPKAIELADGRVLLAWYGGDGKTLSIHRAHVEV